MSIHPKVSIIPALVIVIVVCMACTPPLLALTYPQDFGYSSATEWLIDGGRLWDSNRMFHPLDIGSEIVRDTAYDGSTFDWPAERLVRYQAGLKRLANDAGE